MVLVDLRNHGKSNELPGMIILPCAPRPLPIAPLIRSRAYAERIYAELPTISLMQQLAFPVLRMLV